MSVELAVVLDELRTIKRELSQLRAGASVQLPEDAKKAVEAREIARARGYHTVDTFAACTGLHSRTVSDHCRARVIRTMPTGTKSYHIPLSEEGRYNGQAFYLTNT
jgi:hypothetical protein